MLKSKSILIMLMSIWGCSPNNKNNKEVKALAPISTVNTDQSINNSKEDFDDFFKKFDSDSVFQRSRIKFPLTIITIDETGENNVEKYISKNEINHIGVNKLTELNMAFKKKRLTVDKVEVQFQIENTGYEKDYLFARSSGKWFLILVKDLSD